MESLLVLCLLFAGVLAELDYKGFDVCGIRGWSCRSTPEGYDIIYRCSDTSDPNARIWLWTARIPSAAKFLTVEHCQHVQVHVDCTMGLRSYTLKEFRAFNISHLEFKAPMRPGVFLHDNDEIAQAPPSMLLQKINSTKFLPGMFKPPGGGCRYKSLKLNSIKLIGVGVDGLEKGTFSDQVLDKMSFDTVRVNNIQSDALSVTAKVVEVERSDFGSLPANAIAIKATNVTFSKNKFEKIATGGLLVRSKLFLFTDNKVHEIEGRGLEVTGAIINLHRNNIDHLYSGALEKIAPGYVPEDYEVAQKLSYEFSNNFIENLNPGSLHVNWDAYEKVCSTTDVKDNVFHCSCTNLGWLSLSTGLGLQIKAVKGFYDRFLEEGSNMCRHYNNCTVSTAVKHIKDMCDNKTTIHEICPNVTVEESTTTDAATPQYIDPDIGPEVTLNELEHNDTLASKVSYVENQIVETNSAWLGVVIAIAIVTAALSAAFCFWYRRRKTQLQILQTIFKNGKDKDADMDVVLIGEH